MKKDSSIPVVQLDGDFFRVITLSEVDPEKISGNHRRDFFLILWFWLDSGTHFIDFQPYPVKKGEIYFLAPNQVYSAPGCRLNGVAMAISRELLDGIETDHLKFLFNPFVNDGVLISGETEQSLKQVLGLIQAEESGQKDECLLSAYLKAFLIHAYRQSQSSPVVGSFEDKRLKKLYELVIANFKEEKSTAFYAEKIGLTSKRLNEILKEKFNLTITKFLHNQLILEAKKEISFGEKNFKEIAFDLGFSEQAYFSRFFKKQTGLTPESFQQKMFKLSKYKS